MRLRSGIGLSRASSTSMVLAFAAMLAGTPASLFGQQAPAGQQVAAQRTLVLSEWSSSVWDAARSGKHDAFEGVIFQLTDPSFATAADASAQASLDSLKGDIDRLKTHLARQEADRAARMGELREELDEALEDADNAGPEALKRDIAISKALRSAIEMQLLSKDRKAFVEEGKIASLIQRASSAAHEAEQARDDWMMASELYYRLHALTEEGARFKPDVERLSRRIGMLRLYVPKQLWERRNARQLAEGEKALPPYNEVGDRYQDKLRFVDETLVRRALARTRDHVDGTPINTVLRGGVVTVKTMATTTDLKGAFPGMNDEKAVQEFVGFLNTKVAQLEAADKAYDSAQIDALLRDIRVQNDKTVRLPKEAWLHEFGNGALAELDEFSAIIWPDELRRFNRSTRGQVIGIGVQIQFDEAFRVKVVQPIDGSPAQRAGVRVDDVITKVDGKSTYGMSLDQAVDLITGPPNTPVVVTIERENEDGSKVEKDLELTRAVIDITTVKGWKRTGKGEDDWDWFLDKDAGIGYARLSQFTDQTTPEFDRAVAQMKEQGLTGLVLDLRFNPGGLLDQAVEMVRRFVDVDGPVVMTGTGQGQIDERHMTKPSSARLAHIPIVVLINENSASASEIVSGALGHYGKTGAINCIVLGERSFGKGSVQTVAPVTNNSMMKLTIQYYMLPDERIIHRRPGAATWGVEPDYRVEMLPKQTEHFIEIRRNADLAWEGAPQPKRKPKAEPAADESKKIKPRDPLADSSNPDDMLRQGVDMQLETALVILKSQAVAKQAATASTTK